MQPVRPVGPIHRSQSSRGPRRLTAFARRRQARLEQLETARATTMRRLLTGCLGAMLGFTAAGRADDVQWRKVVEPVSAPVVAVAAEQPAEPPAPFRSAADSARSAQLFAGGNLADRRAVAGSGAARVAAAFREPDSGHGGMVAGRRGFSASAGRGPGRRSKPLLLPGRVPDVVDSRHECAAAGLHGDVAAAAEFHGVDQPADSGRQRHHRRPVHAGGPLQRGRVVRLRSDLRGGWQLFLPAAPHRRLQRLVERARRHSRPVPTDLHSEYF